MIRHYSNRVVFVVVGISLLSVIFAVKQFLILKEHIYQDTLYDSLSPYNPY
jgi:hypothetical protein